MGSAGELENHLLLAGDLKRIKSKDDGASARRALEVQRMLSALIEKQHADRRQLPSETLQVSLAML